MTEPRTGGRGHGALEEVAVTIYLLWRQTSDQYGTESLVNAFDTDNSLVQWLAHNPTPGRVRMQAVEVLTAAMLHERGGSQCTPPPASDPSTS